MDKTGSRDIDLRKYVVPLLATCVVMLVELMTMEELDTWLTVNVYVLAVAIPTLILSWGYEHSTILDKSKLATVVFLIAILSSVLAVALCFFHFSIWAGLFFSAVTFLAIKVVDNLSIAYQAEKKETE
jgi:hypothetical protein